MTKTTQTSKPVNSISEFRRLRRGTPVEIIPFYGSLSQHPKKTMIYRGVINRKHAFQTTDLEVFIRPNSRDLVFGEDGVIGVETAGSWAYRMRNIGGES